MSFLKTPSMQGFFEILQQNKQILISFAMNASKCPHTLKFILSFQMLVFLNSSYKFLFTKGSLLMFTNEKNKHFSF